jgi:hypothetical protein
MVAFEARTRAYPEKQPCARPYTGTMRKKSLLHLGLEILRLRDLFTSTLVRLALIHPKVNIHLHVDQLVVAFDAMTIEHQPWEA